MRLFFALHILLFLLENILLSAEHRGLFLNFLSLINLRGNLFRQIWMKTFPIYFFRFHLLKNSRLRLWSKGHSSIVKILSLCHCRLIWEYLLCILLMISCGVIPAQCSSQITLTEIFLLKKTWGFSWRPLICRKRLRLIDLLLYLSQFLLSLWVW